MLQRTSKSFIWTFPFPDLSFTRWVPGFAATRVIAPLSWQGIVPHFITCNAFIGRSYAQVLSGFLRDCMRGGGGMKLDRTEPLYIIELGAGSGKFSFFMLKALLEMKVRPNLTSDFSAAAAARWARCGGRMRCRAC